MQVILSLGLDVSNFLESILYVLYSTHSFLEAVIQGCFVKKVFLEILQKSQENNCARVSFFNEAAGLRLWHRCFPVNFAEFLRTRFFIEHLWWLLLCYVIICCPVCDVINFAINNSFLIKPFFYQKASTKM